MGIFKSYIKDGVPLTNRLKYSDSTTIGNEPIVQKSIPLSLDAKVPKSTELTKRADDLKRIATLLTQPPGLKYIANETALFALKDKRTVEERLAPPSQATGFKAKLRQLGTNILNNTISGLGQTAKTIGSTLAQVPVNGTGTHFVKGFNGHSAQTYLSGLSVAPHTLVRQGSKVYEDNTWAVEESPTETLGGTKINTNKRLQGSEKYTTLKNHSQFAAKDANEAFSQSVKDANAKLTNKTQVNVKKESRVLLGDASKRSSADRKNYAAPADEATIDKINALAPYDATQDTLENIRNKQRDFIKFRFNVITPEDTDGWGTYLHFRAYLSSFDDNFNGDWNSFKYNGRAEDFHTYSGFSRSINIGFKIAAQTRYEMRPLYKKIVYLASTTAPTYRNNIMRGTLVKATVGDYIWEMPGYISNVSYTWQTDYPWEIALNNPEAVAGSSEQADIYQQELPMVLDCSMTFNPIHKFTPETGLKHYITTPIAKSPKTIFFNGRGEDLYEYESGIGGMGKPAPKATPAPKKLTPSVEVGQGAFGGIFDQGDFIDLDQFGA